MQKVKKVVVPAKRKFGREVRKNAQIIKEINKREFESDFTNQVARHSKVHASGDEAPKIIGRWSGKSWHISLYDDKILTISYKYKGKILVNISLDDNLEEIGKKCSSKQAKLLEELRNRILNN